MAVEWPKTVKTHNLQRLIWAAKSSRGANFFNPSHFARYTSITTSQQKNMAVVWPKTVKTHNLPRLNWAAKSSRGANFFHPSHFARYTYFTASQLNNKCRWVAKNSQNTQFATFNLGRKKFARRELFSSQQFCTLHVFYDVPTKQKRPLCGQKQSKHTICFVWFGPQRVRAARTFFISAILHVKRLLRRPNWTKKAVEWPKTVKTHILPGLIWVAKSSRGANFIHPSHFARYTFFTASQLNKNGRFVAKNSQNTQISTFNLGRKSLRGANFFHPSHFARYTSFTASQLNKNGRWVAKNSQNTQFATFNLGREKFAGRELFSFSHFARYTSFTASQLNKNGRWVAKNCQNTHIATFNLGRKKFARREFYSFQPFCTLHVFYGVPTKQKWPFCGQKQSKHTIFHV